MNQDNSPVKKIRTIFMGTPEFALPGLQALVSSSDFEVIGVFTPIDKPVGRKQILTPPPVKQFALDNNIPVFQPLKIKTETETIKELKPDLVVVIAYGQIITPEILALPTYGFVNVHASLLPKYRGAACLNAPILNGDSETGVTIMRLDAGLDTGPILRQAKMHLNGQESLKDVHDTLSALGANILVPTLRDYVAGKIEPQVQDEAAASYKKTLKKEDGKIDWTKPALEIERLIRAYNPWPGTYAKTKDNKIVKILAVEHEILKTNNKQTGEIFLTDDSLAVQCGQDTLLILKLQLEGGKALSSQEFLNGNANLVGSILN